MNPKNKTNPATDAATGGAANVNVGTDASSSAPAADLQVAYHDGPPGIGYFGRRWARGVAQTVTAEEWAAMQARADFGTHGFKAEA